MNHSHFRHKQRGISLIELMISLALGLAVMALILTSFKNLTQGGKNSQASQKITEDAELAFRIIGQQFSQAGFNPRQPRSATPVKNTLQIGTAATGGMGLFACDQGFSNTTTADNIQALTCNTAGTSTYAFAVQFEADQYSPSITGTTPTDCRGFAVPARSQALPAPAAAATYYVVENRFYVNATGLNCTGNGSSGASTTFATPNQPLVENVESMQLSFGLSTPYATSTAALFIAGYLNSDSIGPASGNDTSGIDAKLIETSPSVLTPIARWDLVKVVRVCLVLKAPTRTLFDLEAGSTTVYGSYRGCDPSVLTNITDGFERKAFVRHFALRSKMPTL